MVKSLDFYFKPLSDGHQSVSLPPSKSQVTIDTVKQKVGVIPVGNDSGSGSSKTQGEYAMLKDKEKTIIGEYAAKHDNAAAMQHFKQKKYFPDLKEATVHGWKNFYLRESLIQSQGRKCDAPLVEIEVLPSKRYSSLFYLETRSSAKSWDESSPVTVITDRSFTQY